MNLNLTVSLGSPRILSTWASRRGSRFLSQTENRGGRGPGPAHAYHVLAPSSARESLAISPATFGQATGVKHHVDASQGKGPRWFCRV